MLAIASLIPVAAGAQPLGKISPNEGSLQITSPANTYALLVHPLQLDEEPDKLVAEMQIQIVEGASGASWAPGIYLYWNTHEWIGIRLTTGLFRAEGQIKGSAFREQDFAVRPNSSEWTGLRLVWLGETVEIYGSTDFQTWHPLTVVARPGDGLPWLMIGKGYAASSLPNPYLANSYAQIDGDVGPLGTSLLRGVKVEADGVTILEENFAAEELDASTWTPLIDGDPQLQHHIHHLNTFYQDVIVHRRERSLRDWESKKVRTNLLSPEQIAEARATRKWPETGADAASIIALADRWMKYTPQELRDMVPPPEVPRAFDVHFKQSPTHPEAIKAFGSYPWIIDPDIPYKVISPVDGSMFPTNDFDPKNPGRPEDVSTEPYVDTGWGWKDPNDPQKYWFVAYWAHWFWLDHLVPAAQALGQAYILTGDQRYSRQALALLDQIAEYYPDMDHVHQSRYGTEIQKGRYHGRIVNLIWETGLVRTLARAYDFAFEGLAGDTELEAITGKSLAEIQANIEQNLLEDAAQSIYTMDGRIRGNFGMHHSALTTIAIVLDNDKTDEYINWVLHATGHGQWMYEGIVPGLTNFIYRDGPAHESSPGYNSGWTSNFHIVTEAMLDRGINMYEDYPKLKRMYDVPLRLSMPGNFTPNIGDAGSVRSSGLVGFNRSMYATAYERYGEPSYLTGVSPYQSSDNMSGYGLGMLRRGSAQTGMGLSLYYGPAGGHGHFDRLNIELFALGQRIMPDLGYPEYMTGYHKKLYGWTGHTISHNTVLVNQQRQHTKDGGRIQSFAGSDKVQYIDVRAEEAYPGVVDRYQRAVAMIDISNRDAYVLDVFRVKGGTHHDYSLHGPDGTFSVDGLELSEVQTKGTLAGEDVPFGYLYDAPQLEVPGYSGSYGGYMGSGYSYLRNIQRGEPDGPWHAEWRLVDNRNAYLRTTFLPEPGMHVAIGDGEPPQNKAGNPRHMKYVLARNTSESEDPLESTFITVIEPHRGTPSITSVTRLTEPSGAEGLVAVALERGDEVDYVFQSPDPSAAHTIGADQFQGRLGVVSRDHDGHVRFAYLLSGRRLHQGDIMIETPGPYEGEIVAIDFDAQEVTVRIDSGSTDPVEEALLGQRIVISNEHHATEYIVEKVAALNDGRYRLTLGDTEFVTGMGELRGATVDTQNGVTILNSRSTFPLLGSYYKGQWLVNDKTGEGARILEFAGGGGQIRVDSTSLNLGPDDTFHIYDFGIGDRFEIGSSVLLDARGDGQYQLQSNVPVQLRLSDGHTHEVGPGTHTIHVLVPSITWDSNVRQSADQVRGVLPIDVSVTTPAELEIEEVIVQFEDETIYQGTGTPQPGTLRFDTLSVADGTYALQVVVRDSLGRRFSNRLPIKVANWWEEIDDLRPPITSGWFAASFDKTSERSSGWEYSTEEPGNFFGDRDRLVRTSDATEFLVWDAAGLREYEVILYAKEARPEVHLAVSTNGKEEWSTASPHVEVEGPNEAGWYQVRLTEIELDAGAMRLTIPEGSAADSIQVGQVILRGLAR